MAATIVECDKCGKQLPAVARRTPADEQSRGVANDLGWLCGWPDETKDWCPDCIPADAPDYSDINVSRGDTIRAGIRDAARRRKAGAKTRESPG